MEGSSGPKGDTVRISPLVLASGGAGTWVQVFPFEAPPSPGVCAAFGCTNIMLGCLMLAFSLQGTEGVPGMRGQSGQEGPVVSPGG